MAALQMLGFAAFIGISAVLGARLLLQWRRTRGAEELSIGLSFLLAGGAGYAHWAALGVLRVLGDLDPVTRHAVATSGLALTCLGALSLAAGLGLVFRPGAGWPRTLAAAFALATSALWGHYAFVDERGMAWSFWTGLGTSGLVFLWGAVEAWILHDVLRKRAALGLASPLMASRAQLWMVASVAIVVIIGASIVQRLLLGPDVITKAVSLFQSCCGLVAATAIWLGFFPPEAWSRRVLRAAGAE